MKGPPSTITLRGVGLCPLSALPLKLPSSTAVISPLLLLETVLGFAQSPLNRRHRCFKSTRVKKTTPCKHKSKESRSGCISTSVGFQVRLLLGQRGALWARRSVPQAGLTGERMRLAPERASPCKSRAQGRGSSQGGLGRRSLQDTPATRAARAAQEWRVTC